MRALIHTLISMSPKPQVQSPPTRPPAWRMGVLGLLLALFFILEEESFALPLFLGVNVRSRNSFVQKPCPMAALGVWSTFLDPCTLPLVRRWGGQLRTQFTSHEGNGDIAHFLYSEGPKGAFFFDESGPTCLVRAFFAVGFGSLTFDVHTGTPPAQVHLAVLGIEVDGVLVLNASIQELFMGREWAEGSSFLPTQSPPGSTLGGEEGGEDRYPAFPSTHNFALERGREGTLHSGWLLQTPICAKDRLRLSLSYPGIAHMYWAPDLLTQQSAICTAQYEKCPVAQYFNVHALRFPGAHLPDQWEPFASPHTPSISPALLSDLGLPPTTKGVLSAARVLEKAVGEAGPGSTGVRKGFLGKGGSPLTIFSSSHGAGVVTSISLDFPKERHLLHSRSIRLVAVWDGGEAVGLSPGKKGSGGGGVGGGLSGDGVPEPYTAWGWSDWDNKRGGGNTTSPPSSSHSTTPPSRKGGFLEFDLEAILGPQSMGEEGPRADPSATHINCRKELYLVGEMPAEGGMPSSGKEEEGGGGPRGFYFTLPAPFWHTATIQLFYDTVDGENVDYMAPQTEVVYRVTTAPNPHFYVEGVAGYLQGGTESLVMEEGMRGNVLAEVRNTRGSLALVAAHVVGVTQQFVEGDLRVWTDGSPSPNVWESGWEDFFNGSHGYDEDLHHCGEALFSYDRVDPLFWGWHNNSHTTVHFFQIRLLMGDAVTFEDSFRMAVEGLPVKYKGTVRALTLWYGYPTSSPLHTSDWVYPGEEWEPSQLVVLGPGGSSSSSGGGGGGGTAPEVASSISDALNGKGAFLPSPLHPHGYAVVAPASTSLSRYTLTSGLPSYGEWVKIVLLKCFRKKQCEHEGAGGGVSVTVEGALAVEEGWVSFTVAVDPGAERVFLRRLVDIRYGVQRVALRVDGVDCGAVGSSDREYLHMHTSWKVDTVRLPQEVTQGKSSLRITLRVLPEDVKTRVFPDFSNLGWGWTEARWEVVNVPHLF